MLSPEQVGEFETNGYTLVQSTLSPQELDDAEETWHRLQQLRNGGFGASPDPQAARENDEGFVRLVSHPFFENVAKQMLRTEDVRLIELGANNRAPTGEPQAPAEEQAKRWAAGAHVDLQITTADFNATPRRDLLALWFWISDVTPDHAAMRILPGSHLTVMQHWEETLAPERKRQLPRVHGLLPAPSVDYPSYPEYIPPHATLDYSSHIPTPVAVKRGTAQVFTQSMLHSSWHNSTSEPRKGFIISWSALGVPIGFEAGRTAGLQKSFSLLRPAVAKHCPGREHIVPSAAEFAGQAVVSDYDPAWPECFIPGKTLHDRGGGGGKGFADKSRAEAVRVPKPPPAAARL